MNRTLKMLLVGAALTPFAAMADDNLSYTYVQAGYAQTDIDDVNADGDEYSLSGSLALSSNWHTFAGFSKGELDDNGADFDVTGWQIGLGYNHPVNSKADVIARLSYLRMDIDTPLGDADEDGFGISVGLRGRLAPAFELEGAVNYTDLGDFGDDTSFGAAARYFFTPAFAAGLNLGIGDDTTSYGVHFRLNFK